MTLRETTSRWTTFWNRGGWWRSALLAVVYLALYLGAGWVSGQLFGDQINAENLFATAPSVFFGLTLPLLVGSLLLAGFALSVGWLKPLFARQPITGGWWMWIAPVIVSVAILLRLLGIDYGGYDISVVVLTLLTGLLIGFAEEILTRGFIVKMLRDSGKSEWAVMMLSSLIFAALHSTNIFSGASVITVLLTMVFAFAFGICMYLTLRATGNLIWPMLIHGLYDPTLFLASGGIDQAASGEQSVFLTLAGPANFVFIAFAIVAIIFVRGRVRASADASLPRVSAPVS